MELTCGVTADEARRNDSWHAEEGPWPRRWQSPHSGACVRGWSGWLWSFPRPERSNFGSWLPSLAHRRFFGSAPGAVEPPTSAHAPPPQNLKLGPTSPIRLTCPVKHVKTEDEYYWRLCIPEYCFTQKNPAVMQRSMGQCFVAGTEEKLLSNMPALGGRPILEPRTRVHEESRDGDLTTFCRTNTISWNGLATRGPFLDR